MENEVERVKAFADERDLRILATIPRSQDIINFEDEGKTVIEGNPELPVSKEFFNLAKMLIEECEEEDNV